MKLSNLYLLLFFTLVLVGCQKEPSAELPENTRPGETADGNRLSRMVYQYSPTDSAYTDFFYDGAGRWIGQRTVGDDFAVLTGASEIRVTRNAAGIITKYTEKEDDGSGNVDSTVYTVYYDNVAKRYTSKVNEFEINGQVLVDSTVFLINNGRMATQRYLYKERVSGLFLEVGKLEFIYDANGNPITINTYSNNPTTGASQKEAEIGLQFDTKVSSLNLGVEGFVMDQIFFGSPNNITRLNYMDLSDPSAPDEDLITITYQYHASNKPKSAEIQVDGDNIPLFFRYQ